MAIGGSAGESDKILAIRLDFHPHAVLVELSKFLQDELAINKKSENNQFSLWHWNQIATQLETYIFECNEIFAVNQGSMENESWGEQFEWADNPEEIGVFTYLDDFLHHVKFILGLVLDHDGKPFRGNILESLVRHAEEALGAAIFWMESDTSRMGELVGEPEPERFSIAPEISGFMHLRVQDEKGKTIDKSEDEDAWLSARKKGITASDANRLIKLNGERRSTFFEVLASKSQNYRSPYFEAYDLGIEREPEIAEWVIRNFSEEGFIPNNWLFESEFHDGHLATPDLVGVHSIAEIKVASKPLMQMIARYQDQLQWQLHVLDCDRVLFVVEQRATQEIETKWIERDEDRIAILIEAANYLLGKMGQ